MYDAIPMPLFLILFGILLITLLMLMFNIHNKIDNFFARRRHIRRSRTVNYLDMKGYCERDVMVTQQLLHNRSTSLKDMTR